MLGDRLFSSLSNPLTPQTICYSTGFDLLSASLSLLFNEQIIVPKKKTKPSICYALHSNKEGKFKDIRLDESLIKYVTEQHIYVQAGDVVRPYSEPGSTIGVLLFSFPGWIEADIIIPEL